MVGTDSWRIHTAEGHVAVRDDAFTFRSRPTPFLAGKWRSFREADRRERFKHVAVVGAPLLSLAVSLHGYVGRIGTGMEWPEYVMIACLLFYPLALLLEFRPDAVDRSEIRSVELDPEAGTIAITHWDDDGVLGWSGSSRRTRELSLRSAEAVREARSILRLRGVEFEEVDERAAPDDGQGVDDSAGTAFRAVTRSGVSFCAYCDRQVSPNDRRCPTCGYELRVEAASESKSESEPERAD